MENLNEKILKREIRNAGLGVNCFWITIHCNCLLCSGKQWVWKRLVLTRTEFLYFRILPV